MKSSAVCSCLGHGYLKNESNNRGADVGGGFWFCGEGVERRMQQPIPASVCVETWQRLGMAL